MKPTLAYIEQQFERFNRLCFKGELPAIPIRLSNAKSFMGKLVYRTRRDLPGRKHAYDLHLVFSTRLDVDEQEIEDTILHEMIHYYIHYQGLKDTSTHGVLFRRLMDELNTRYGRHITVSRRLSADERQQMAGDQRRLRVFALVTTDKGEQLIKVVPRVRQRVQAMDRDLKRIGKFVSVRWYYSDHPYFGQFPCSTALRLQYIDKDSLQNAMPECRLLDI